MSCYSSDPGFTLFRSDAAERCFGTTAPIDREKAEEMVDWVAGVITRSGGIMTSANLGSTLSAEDAVRYAEIKEIFGGLCGLLARYTNRFVLVNNQPFNHVAAINTAPPGHRAWPTRAATSKHPRPRAIGSATSMGSPGSATRPVGGARSSSSSRHRTACGALMTSSAAQHVLDQSDEMEVVRQTWEILHLASEHQLKAVDLANALRSRVGVEILGRVRLRFGGLLALLERHRHIIHVQRVPKHDLVCLVEQPCGPTADPHYVDQGSGEVQGLQRYEPQHLYHNQHNQRVDVSETQPNAHAQVSNLSLGMNCAVSSCPPTTTTGPSSPAMDIVDAFPLHYHSGPVVTPSVSSTSSNASSYSEDTSYHLDMWDAQHDMGLTKESPWAPPRPDSGLDAALLTSQLAGCVDSVERAVTPPRGAAPPLPHPLEVGAYTKWGPNMSPLLEGDVGDSRSRIDRLMRAAFDRLMSDEYVPTQPWPASVYEDGPLLSTVLELLEHYRGCVVLSKLRSALKYRHNLPASVKSVPLRAFLVSHPQHFRVEGSRVYLRRRAPGREPQCSPEHVVVPSSDLSAF